MSTILFTMHAGVVNAPSLASDVDLTNTTTSGGPYAANFDAGTGTFSIAGNGCALTAVPAFDAMTALPSCQWVTTLVTNGSTVLTSTVAGLFSGSLALQTAVAGGVRGVTLLVSPSSANVTGDFTLTLTDASGPPTRPLQYDGPSTVLDAGNWKVTASGGIVVVLRKLVTPTTVLWLQFDFEASVQVAITPSVESNTSAGVVAVLTSTTSAPPVPCLGADTVVLMADGSRRRVGSLACGDRVVAVSPDGSTHAIAVDVLVRRHCASATAIDGCRPALYTLAPGVRVTGDHLVLLRRGSHGAARLMKPRAAWTCAACRRAPGADTPAPGTDPQPACPGCCTAVRVDGFVSFLGKDSTVTPTCGLCGDETSVYHVSLREHPEWALVVGSAAADDDGIGDILVEGYRTPVATAVASGQFVLVEPAV
jgi:hypothetical protein